MLVARREIIANLSKAAGLATMIAAMRPDIDNVDEYVRNTTARAFSGGPACLHSSFAPAQPLPGSNAWRRADKGCRLVWKRSSRNIPPVEEGRQAIRQATVSEPII